MAPTMLEELCKGIQLCCTPLQQSWNKRNVGSCWLKSWTSFKLCTTPNNMQQGVQMGVTCNIQQCWELLANNIVSVIDVYEINVVSICTGLNSSVLLRCNHLLFGGWSLSQVNGIDRLKNYNYLEWQAMERPIQTDLSSCFLFLLAWK